MWTRLIHWWELITTGYWFVPTLLSVAAAVLASILLYTDANNLIPDEHSGWLYTGGADGAKTVLSTIAGSVITVAGVAYSITIAALSQASSQFGPRLLRNFMRDTGNQIVLGTFAGTFLYCLLVLRAIRGEIEDGSYFVPHASVTVAVLMAATSIAMLIYFIHHISVSLQAPSVVAAVAADLHASIRALSCREQDQVPRTSALEPLMNGAPATVEADFDGYIQAVNREKIVESARREGGVVKLLFRPGDHVIRGSALACVWPAEACKAPLKQAINGSLISGHQRTAEQDVEFAFRQLVEIAVRALSPGVNDPFTAIDCIDALGSGLCEAARCGEPESRFLDDEGAVRLLLPATTFQGLVGASFNPIRQYGSTSVAVTVRLLEVLTECARQVTREAARDALRRQATWVYEEAVRVLKSGDDLADVTRRWDAFERFNPPATPT